MSQDDIDAGSVVNEATVQAKNPQGEEVSHSDVHEETSMFRLAGITLGKSYIGFLEKMESLLYTEYSCFFEMPLSIFERNAEQE